ncbi:hypothetical protein GCM10023321_26070 [Pseudonocardia eucalypti]|uniref:Uncharacterized protein n=1 Tax=Pseudonocardia eucalypti TaxID=648755 RepID=A0ABP9PZR5_9PSEU|nr:hypothetical protein [Pseudonocardia eucalypti]
MTLSVNQSGTYVAAVDIRSTPEAPELVLPGVNAQAAPVAVQCVLSARLVPVGDGVDVEDRSWIVRQFTPTGVLNWSWSVKALQPSEHELRLELQPALKISEPRAGAELLQREHPFRVTSFVTKVHVQATWGQALNKWWKEASPVIAAIAAGLSAAVLAVIKWSGALADALRETVQKWRGQASETQPTSRQRSSAGLRSRRKKKDVVQR